MLFLMALGGGGEVVIRNTPVPSPVVPSPFSSGLVQGSSKASLVREISFPWRKSASSKLDGRKSVSSTQEMKYEGRRMVSYFSSTKNTRRQTSRIEFHFTVYPVHEVGFFKMVASAASQE